MAEDGYGQGEMHGKPGEDMSWTTRAILFVLMGGAGGFQVGAYFGWYYWPPIRRCRAIFCDPHHWQIFALGLAFFCAGLAFILPRRWKRLGQTNAVCLVVSLVSGLVGTFLAR